MDSLILANLLLFIIFFIFVSSTSNRFNQIPFCRRVKNRQLTLTVLFIKVCLILIELHLDLLRNGAFNAANRLFSVPAFDSLRV